MTGTVLHYCSLVMSDSSEASFLQSQGPKPKKTKYGRYVQDITKEEIESVFCFPAEVACTKLGICLTILKRLCRKFGIQRWPYRRLKCTARLHLVDEDHEQVADGSLAANFSSHPVHPSRRSSRPVRQASLGVQMAVGKAKAEIYDDEVASVPVLPRAKKSSYSVPLQGQPVPPAIPEPGPEQQAYHSVNLDTSQSLGGLGASPRYARSSDYEPSVHLGTGAAGATGNAGRMDYSDHSFRENPSQQDFISSHTILDSLAAAAASRVHQDQQQQAVAAAAATTARPAFPAGGSLLSDMDPAFVKHLLQRAICELSNLVNTPHPSLNHAHPQPHPTPAPAPAPIESQAPIAGLFGGSVPHRNNSGFSRWNSSNNTYSHVSPFHYQPTASEWASRSSR